MKSGTEAYQFFSDCNETDSVVKECITIAQSKDFGQDKLTAISLLQRHKQLVYKIQSLAVDLQRVQVIQSALCILIGINSLLLF
jgi:hypothetical protein